MGVGCSLFRRVNNSSIKSEAYWEHGMIYLKYFEEK